MSLNTMKSNLGDKAVDEFLDAQSRKSTFRTYKTQMKSYLEFTQKNGQQLLDEKRNDKDFQVENSLFEYRKFLLQKGKSEYYAASSIGCIRGFYAYNRMPLQFRRQESKKLSERNRSTQDYLFDKDDLAKMALAGNLKERYILLVGKSVGLRASDFLKFTYGTFRSLKLENEAPIGLGETGTGKERVKAYPFLDSDAIPIVKAWLESHKEAKDSSRILDDTEDNLSVILQTLARKAGMEIENGAIHGKRIRFHSLRKFLIDRLSAYTSESQWKQIVGKSIDEGAYVSQDQLRGIFTRAMKDLLINGNGIKAKKLLELENALKQVELENANFKTRIDGLQKQTQEVTEENAQIRKDYDNMKPLLEFVNSFPDKEGIKKFVDSWKESYALTFEGTNRSMTKVELSEERMLKVEEMAKEMGISKSELIDKMFKTGFKKFSGRDAQPT
jgi:hypothetical protein